MLVSITKSYYNDLKKEISVKKAILTLCIFTSLLVAENQEKQETCQNGKECYEASIFAEAMKLDIMAANFAIESCDKFDYSAGCRLLGHYYEIGFGLKQDEQQAALYHARSCLAKDALGCNNLGWTLYEKEKYSEALSYANQACNMDVGASCRLLGLLYFKGWGVRQSDKTSYEFMLKGCKLQDNTSCLLTAGYYADGIGVQRNLQKAREYAGKSCDMGLQEGCDYYKEFNDTLKKLGKN